MRQKTEGGVRTWIGTNLLLVLTLFSVIIGVIVGGSLRYTEPSHDTIRLIGFPGELFMNMLKAMILPLISASLISGLSQLDGKTSGKLGSRALMYYALTTTHAVILGIIVVSIIHPGHTDLKHATRHMQQETEHKVSALDKFLDLFRNMFPENIVRTMFQQQTTDYKKETDNATGEVVLKPHTTYTDGMNVLGLILFCILMGMVISRVGKPAKPLADLFSALDVVITKIVGLIMWLGPIGIPSLIAQKMLEVENLLSTAQMLGMFIVTVIFGLALQCFVTLPLIYLIFTRHNPYKFLAGLGQAVLTALGTASSAASLPITFKCVNDLGIDKRVTKFVLPVGSMVNMDGTALYEAVASIFIAQMNGMELGIGQLVTVSITATLASVGAASIPSAGLVTMLIVLTALGLPVTDISLIFAIDWFLDRLRTSVNVIGDAFGCGFVYHLVKEDLDQLNISDTQSFEAHGMKFDDSDSKERLPSTLSDAPTVEA